MWNFLDIDCAVKCILLKKKRLHIKTVFDYYLKKKKNNIRDTKFDEMLLLF